MTETIKNILIQRDHLTEDDAQTLINQAMEALQEYLENDDTESAYEVCGEFFGLEPDYLDYLI